MDRYYSRSFSNRIYASTILHEHTLACSMYICMISEVSFRVYRLQCMSWGLRVCPSHELQYYQLGHTAHDDRASTHSDYAS